MKKIFFSILTVVLLQSTCLAIGTKSTMEKIMDSWIGENIETVITHWGYPTDEKVIAGKKLYFWRESSYVVTGNQYGVFGGDNTCVRIIEVDKNNNVIKWQWNGNNCPATYCTGKKWVNPTNNPWKQNKTNL